MKKVINKIIEMLVNNKELGACGMAEDLIGWLELGDTKYEDLTEADFEYMYENNNLTKKEVKLVYEINPYVEQLTDKLVEMWEMNNVKECDNMEDLLNNYIDNCTDKEWEELLNNYNIEDEENYMGEVRENAEETIMEIFENSTEEEKQEMLNFFSKYNK